MKDEEGYPTEETLSKIKAWDFNDFFGLVAFIKENWNYNDAYKERFEFNELFDRHEYILDISTFGWSGNEDIIKALQENELIWLVSWYSSQRGGHYTFRINPEQLGYLFTSDYCKHHGVSRQWISKAKGKFEKVIISQNKVLVRPITIL